jgi:hypothetical protein
MQSDTTRLPDLLQLPGLLAEIEEVAGRSAAVTIAASFGGHTKEFPVPERLKAKPEHYANHWLVVTVGHHKALAIVSALFPAGGRFELPSARKAMRWQFVLDNAALLTVPEMAACLEVTERCVRRIKSELRKEGLIP